MTSKRYYIITSSRNCRYQMLLKTIPELNSYFKENQTTMTMARLRKHLETGPFTKLDLLTRRVCCSKKENRLPLENEADIDIIRKKTFIIKRICVCERRE
ncbi:hypothetical protein TNCT_449121 [Trichonephila clavata]|uniref:Uncharacterized protein n=1 Tax=Trichonephila clavata TaxID=2740835 RepID=A0A8X6HJU5_TRICU|nr:hypothetical protein TNCT_449121 [Trichonephila clavata]